MKTYVKYAAILVLFMTLKSEAQLNLPLKFQEDAIKWSELSWMEGQNSKDQWVLISSPPVIKDDTIYLFMNYYQKELESGKNYGYCGYIIKKLNVSTGQKYWETKRKYKEYGNRKMLSQPSFVHGTIEIPMYDEVLSNAYGTDWYECYPSQITLDSQSGIIIDSNYVDKADTVIPGLRSFGGLLYYGGSTRPTIFKTEKGFIHIKRDLGQFERSYLDSNGRLIKKDSIKYPTYKYAPWDIRFAQTETDSFWVVMLNRAQNWTNIQVLFSKYDKHLNLDTTYDVSAHFKLPITDAALYNFEHNYLIVVTKYADQQAKTEKYSYYLFDKNADFVDSVSYTFRPDIDDKIRYARIYPVADQVNKRILFSQSRQDKITQSTYYILYSNDGDKLKIIRTINVEGIDDHFSILYSTMMENGDILLYIEQFTDLSSSASRWFSWVMLDGQKMNIVNSTKDVAVVKNKLKVYPNPTSGIINVMDLDTPAYVTITNMNGQIVKQLSNVTNDINIADLPAGMYIFDIRNIEIRGCHKIVKVE